jgi:hypothetical protein
MAPAVVLGCLYKPFDLPLGQIRAWPKLAVRGTGRRNCPFYRGRGDQVGARRVVRNDLPRKRTFAVALECPLRAKSAKRKPRPVWDAVASNFFVLIESDRSAWAF